MLTEWGYTIQSEAELPDFITEAEFNAITASKYAGDARIVPNLAAVSAIIRNYCGWHVYPSEPCKLETNFFDNRITPTRGGILIQLPARYVSGVSSVKIGGAECTEYALDPTGLLRVRTGGADGYTPIVIEYRAGLPAGMAKALQELAAHRVTHALAASYGVQSETSGGVSITYSANWINSARSTALPDDNKEVLEYYRLQGVF